MRDDYAKRILDNDVFVIRHGKRIIGVLVVIVETPCCLLDNVAVHPDFAGRGLGRRLVDFAERHAVERGFTEIELYTHELMSENIAMYQRWGYQIVRKVTEHGYRRIYMRRQLALAPGNES
ncbi:GNAT family N-acetyltransferase [Candidatus Spongiihabitans sp.]|uniref:GNAT family N-acetyltransferase n=1 Tax=Candidatus Spongiihabitans sp. TaxID=3101308 RepID=UPI003C7C5F5F